MAQLVEQFTRNEQVAGSSPASSSKIKTPENQLMRLVFGSFFCPRHFSFSAQISFSLPCLDTASPLPHRKAAGAETVSGQTDPKASLCWGPVLHARRRLNRAFRLPAVRMRRTCTTFRPQGMQGYRRRRAAQMLSVGSNPQAAWTKAIRSLSHTASQKGRWAAAPGRKAPGTALPSVHLQQ